MTQPIVNARLRPIIAPILAPVIISAAITSVYIVIAVWIPVTVVPTSSATCAMDTFITELSRVIRNCPEARVSRTNPEPLAAVADAEPETVDDATAPPSGLLLDGASLLLLGTTTPHPARVRVGRRHRPRQ